MGVLNSYDIFWNDRLVAALNVVLRYDAVVHHALLGQEVCRDGLLQKCITLKRHISKLIRGHTLHNDFAQKLCIL